MPEFFSHFQNPFPAGNFQPYTVILLFRHLISIADMEDTCLMKNQPGLSKSRKLRNIILFFIIAVSVCPVFFIQLPVDLFQFFLCRFPADSTDFYNLPGFPVLFRPAFIVPDSALQLSFFFFLLFFQPPSEPFLKKEPHPRGSWSILKAKRKLGHSAWNISVGQQSAFIPFNFSSSV